MKYLKIKSKGEIEVGAFTLIGASTKKGKEGFIGVYGSGNKYSIASLLRNNLLFNVFSGKEEIKFTTKKQEFRNTPFETICVNGVETSLTTTMGGEEWDDSFSYIREIYSNALDEDSDAVLELTEDVQGEEGYTTFFIQATKEVTDFYNNVFNYFCTNNPSVIYSSNSGSIYPAEDNNIRLFRKGILCHKNGKEKSLFHYNGDFKINESRVLSDEWDARYKVGQIWQTCTDEKMIKQLLLGLHGGNAGFYEHKMILSDYLSFSEAWSNVISDLKFVGVEHVNMFEKKDIKGRIVLPFEMLKKLRSKFPHIDVLGVSSTSTVKIESKPSDKLVNKVLDALSLLYGTEYSNRFRGEPKIKYFAFEDSGTLAEADNGEIHLSVKMDTLSVDEVAKIIIEENEHNLSGFGDETRAFQNHLFNLYFESLTENKMAI